MTKVFLIRHGATDWNKVHRIQGSGADPPLNEEGRRQAEMLAGGLGEAEVLYSSPLLRARQTAEFLARRRSLDVVIEPDLREINAGVLEGVSNKDLGMTLAQYLTIPTNGDLPCPPGGESLRELQERSWRALSRITGAHPGSTIAVVSHYFVILTIICHVIGLDLLNLDRLRLDTGSVSVVRCDERSWWLGLFNATVFL